MKNHSFLFGYTLFSIKKENVEKLINLCNAKQISFGEIALGEESAVFRIALSQERKFKKEAEKCGIEIELVSRKGLPALLIRYRRRVGLLIGAILTIALLCFYSGVVWEIRIEGSDSIDKNAIIEDLAKCGFEIGTRKSEVSTSEIENRLLILSDEISWVSINIKGTVASVVVRGAEYPPQEEIDPTCSNVVAATGGTIVGFEDVKGEICVNIGDNVSKGQVLISGISGAEGEPLRIMAAKGRVLAEVEEEIKIEISRKYQKKVTKSVIKEEKYLIFFKNEIKIFSNSRNSEASYDKIDIIENMYTDNGKKLPFAIKTVKYIEYEYVDCTRTDEQMQNLANEKLYRYINEELEGAQILSKSIESTISEESCILVCKMRSIKNIAEMREVEITP